MAWAIVWVFLPFIELGNTRRALILGVGVRHHGSNFGHGEADTSGTYLG